MAETEKPIEIKKKVKRPSEPTESKIKGRHGTSGDPVDIIRQKERELEEKYGTKPKKIPKKTSKKILPKRGVPKPKLERIVTSVLDLTISTPGKEYLLDPDALYVQIQVMTIKEVAPTLNHYAKLGYAHVDFALTPIGKIWIILKKVKG